MVEIPPDLECAAILAERPKRAFALRRETPLHKASHPASQIDARAGSGEAVAAPISGHRKG